MNYQRHREYNKRVRAEQRQEERRERFVREGRCLKCSIIKKYDGGDNHRCDNPYDHSRDPEIDTLYLRNL